MDTEKIYILCIETSTSNCSVSIGLNDKILAYRTSKDPSDHSRNLTIFIQEILEESNISTNKISAVAISEGPGSYTGLRIGASVAKAICFALDIPMIAIDSCQILSDHYEVNHDYTIGIIDARKGNCYLSIKDHLKNEISSTIFIQLTEQFFEMYSNNRIIINGNGVHLAEPFLKKLRIDYKIIFTENNAVYMHTISYTKYKEKKFINPYYFSPNYINKPNIIKKLN